MTRFTKALSAVSVTVAALLVLPAQSAYADPSPTCRMAVETPVVSDSPTGPGAQVTAKGGRAFGCIESATLTVRLRQDVSFGFDKNLAQATVFGTDTGLTVHWECEHSGAGITVFVEALSSLGGKAQSKRVTVFPCRT